VSCNEDLIQKGSAYPRTCEDCGLGPCKKKAKKPIELRLDARIAALGCSQAVFCLRAMLAVRRISEDDMEATLNFMEQMNVQ
jgi:hypothetical protein